MYLAPLLLGSCTPVFSLLLSLCSTLKPNIPVTAGCFTQTSHIGDDMMRRHSRPSRLAAWQRSLWRHMCTFLAYSTTSRPPFPTPALFAMLSALMSILPSLLFVADDTVVLLASQPNVPKLQIDESKRSVALHPFPSRPPRPISCT